MQQQPGLPAPHALQRELGIGPLGHRAALLGAIATLATHAEDQAQVMGSGAQCPRAQLASAELPAQHPPNRAHRRALAPAGGRNGVAMRPGSARPPSPGRARQLSASSGPRRPASASRAGLIPPDAFLGPAMGKITVRRQMARACSHAWPPALHWLPPTGDSVASWRVPQVYEQRAKLQFELDRAALRAAQQRTLVSQLAHTAATSSEEVAHLRGLLQVRGSTWGPVAWAAPVPPGSRLYHARVCAARPTQPPACPRPFHCPAAAQDLERRNKLGGINEVTGLDSNARIPWRPPTAHQVLNPHPERFGRPGDDPALDCTFHPRIKPLPRGMLAGRGGGSGLDRVSAGVGRAAV